MTIKCQHCGSTDGYYRYARVTGDCAFHYNADGTSGDNTHLHDGLGYREQKTMYCNTCHKKIGIYKEATQ